MQRAQRRILRLQAFTILWMTLEVGVALFAAATSHSPAVFAFGSDSIVELLSALTVLLPWITNSVPHQVAARVSGWLLILLAVVVAGTAALSLALHLSPRPSRAGIAITAAALIVMPVLAALKRREAARTGNIALSADAVQSATCAWIALMALIGLAANALFSIAWLDSVAALAIVPLLIREGRSALKGQPCGCCGEVPEPSSTKSN
jgi:divalent metal cation (Fe/Co/Zn/Cd) transporter